ncbi:pyridine nucleotide-disulphide oxidoreductase domain containing protein, putative [Babesia bigemina]|uniref:Pyridine nucleotide-disulphide oxidoreductase domain containing protein, putative n=1 Tax=Babesia bigemina TaxID=5866 RepID=A0A061DBY1_BABBI|nr:pyridine nucleotide-disulphide oxidoreductase domain containing protein, putative [Babesia bigemina]CDR96399.1 pyridine nucleotide-disulphide oxidoreductase domain containing protein, putative [Babesia bigemina]|eukprot:XP_012768585.1 pyridine nucleotide-disulphide oxidoreductase domain containing protein, putative [Babesia bigemina]
MREVPVHGGRDLVLVTNVKGKFYCTGAKCPHFAASFLDGACTEEHVICPWHNAKFDIATGECVNGPCFDAIPSFKVEVDGDSLYAYLPPTPIADCVDKPHKCQDAKDKRVFVICGGGAAAHSAAETLRQEGFGGRILIYGDEKYLPYYRPHLTKRIESKSYDKVASEQALRPLAWYRANQVEYYGGKRVTSVNHEDNTITLDDGSTVKYDKVLVATGSVAAKLPMTRGMAPLSNHFTIRTVDDLRELVPQIKKDTKVVIVGANFIGCEMASSLKSTGANITVITDMAVPMSNIIGERGGSAIMKLMQNGGVNVLTSQQVKSYTIKGGRVTNVVTANATLDADVVIEGVGARVEMGLLKCAEVNRDGTINVDSSFRCKGCPDNVFAAGDIVTYPYHIDGSPISVKHWNVALQHGRVAAKNMLGGDAKMNMVPFFWSNFFRKGFRFAGVANGVEDIIYEGDLEKYKFVAYYIKASKVVAMLSMGMDNVGANMAEALDKGCAPSYASLKLGAENSETMLQCLRKRMQS